MGVVYTFQVSDDGKYIVSGSTEQTVRVWCGQTGVQRHVLQGHTSIVRCMSLHGTTLVSGSSDQTLRVWDIVDGTCLHILTGHLAEVWYVQFDGIRVVSGANDFTVKVWNVRRGTCIAILLIHERPYYGMQLRENSMVVCYAYPDVGVWDIRDGSSCIHHIHGVNGHTSTITSLQLLDSGLLVTSSYDGSVKVWDVDKGIFVRDLVRLQSGNWIWSLFAAETFPLCAIGSLDITESAKLILIDFDASYP